MDPLRSFLRSAGLGRSTALFFLPIDVLLAAKKRLSAHPDPTATASAELCKGSSGKKRLADITHVDAARTHVGKPRLHPLVAGSFDTHAEEIEYLEKARWNLFEFRLGSLVNVNRSQKTV